MCGETTPFTILFGLLSALLGAALIFFYGGNAQGAQGGKYSQFQTLTHDSDHQEDTSPTQEEEQYEVITTYGSESSIQTESGRMILMSENESYALSKQWSHH